MSAILQHIRGTSAEWAAHDVVLADGETGIGESAAGKVKMKVGNGRAPFSGLPFTDGEVRIGESSTLTLKDKDDVRCGTVSSLDVALPSSPDSDFCACFSFTSGTSSPLVTFSAAVTFSGDSVFEGTFAPASDKHYTVLLWFDGTYQGAVRGV
ncbi:MAG: hypothetical protein MJ082_05215 [Clostridia bacterium]|nr:hypothetical protein [Clostridia bacterium]